MCREPRLLVTLTAKPVEKDYFTRKYVEHYYKTKIITISPPKKRFVRRGLICDKSKVVCY